MSASKIAPGMPTGVDIVRTLLGTRGRLRTKHLYALGLVGWPTETVVNPLPPQPLHVLDARGEIKMRRAYNVRGGMAPWRPKPEAPYPDHPFQSAKFFKSRILTALEERSLIRKIMTRVPLETPTDKAEALAKAVKMTRRRQRNLAQTPEVGLGKGFRLQKAERKIWEAKVYSLPVEVVQPEMTKNEYVWEVCGMTVEAERAALEKAGFSGVKSAPRKNENHDVETIARDDMAPAADVIPLPTDLLSTEHLETVLQHPEAIPKQLRPDPTMESPLPLALPTDSPLIQATSLILSHPPLVSRWKQASDAERAYNDVIEHEQREIQLRRQRRRETYKKTRERTRQAQEDRFRDVLEDRPHLMDRVERVYGDKEQAERFWQAGRDRS